MMPFKSPNYTQTPNDLFDELMCEMTEAELKVVLAVVRGTFGYHQKKFSLSVRKMSETTGLSSSTVMRGAKAAEKRGLIKRSKSGNKSLEWQAIVSVSTVDTQKTPLSQIHHVSTVGTRTPLSQIHHVSTVEEQSGLKKGERKKERGKKETAPAAIAVLEHELEVTFSKHDSKNFSESLPEADETSAKKFIYYWRTVDPRGKKKDSYPPTAKQIIGLWKMAQNKTSIKKSLPLHRAKR